MVVVYVFQIAPDIDRHAGDERTLGAGDFKASWNYDSATATRLPRPADSKKCSTVADSYTTRHLNLPISKPNHNHEADHGPDQQLPVLYQQSYGA
jgi:hypothetical protein